MENDLISKSILKTLHASALKFLVPLTADETYKIIVAQAKEITKANYCSIFLNISGNLERVYSSSPKLFAIKIRKTGYTYRAFRQKKPIIVDAVKTAKVHPELIDLGIKSTIYIPLLYWKKCVGVLSVDSFRKDQFSKSDMEILKLFGSLAMVAIRKSQLHDQLIESLKTRDLFISLASHELRTPLTTINSYEELIENQVMAGKPVNKKWLKIVRDETQRLILMVNELLQLDTIKSGKLKYQWKKIRILDVLDRVIVAFKARYPNRLLDFENKLESREFYIYADFDKLMQSFFNILSNAAKFSSPASRISLTIKDPKHSFEIIITDKGKGIAKKDIGRIFEGFYKGENSTKEGIGLGLYLAKNIIEIHRGKINLDSESGKGTKVIINLPKLKT